MHRYFKFDYQPTEYYKTMSAISSSSSALGSQISLAIASKTQDVAKAQGENVVSMLRDAAQIQQQLSSGPRDSSRGALLDVVA